MSTCRGSRWISNSRSSSGVRQAVPSTTIANLSVIVVRRTSCFSCRTHVAGDDALDARGRADQQRALVVDARRDAAEKLAPSDAHFHPLAGERRALAPLIHRARALPFVVKAVEL